MMKTLLAFVMGLSILISGIASAREATSQPIASEQIETETYGYFPNPKLESQIPSSGDPDKPYYRSIRTTNYTNRLDLIAQSEVNKLDAIWVYDNLDGKIYRCSTSTDAGSRPVFCSSAELPATPKSSSR